MYRPILFTSIVAALLTAASINGVAAAEPQGSEPTVKEKASSCEKIISTFAQIAQNGQDDEQIRLAAIQGMVEIFETSQDDEVEHQVIDALLKVVENREETTSIRESAIQALLDLVRRILE